MSCKIQGCRNAVAAKGLCAMHYMRFKRHGDATATHKPGPKPQPRAESADDSALRQENAALRKENAELRRRAAAARDQQNDAATAKPSAKGGAARIRELERGLQAAKMQLDLAQDALRRQAQVDERNPLVAALRMEIKTLKGQLAHAKGQAQPPSALRETIKKLRAQIRDISRKHTVALPRHVRLRIIKCLHPDQMPPAVKAALKQDPKAEKQFLEAAQLFNLVFINELEKGPGEVASLS